MIDIEYLEDLANSLGKNFQDLFYISFAAIEQMMNIKKIMLNCYKMQNVEEQFPLLKKFEEYLKNTIVEEDPLEKVMHRTYKSYFSRSRMFAKFYEVRHFHFLYCCFLCFRTAFETESLINKSGDKNIQKKFKKIPLIKAWNTAYKRHIYLRKDTKVIEEYIEEKKI